MQPALRRVPLLSTAIDIVKRKRAGVCNLSSRVSNIAAKMPVRGGGVSRCQ
jgi:hypothetical protein